MKEVKQQQKAKLTRTNEQTSNSEKNWSYNVQLTKKIKKKKLYFFDETLLMLAYIPIYSYR